MIFVTGGAGFIGSAFVRNYCHNEHIVILDAMTYAADLERISICKDRISFIEGDICDFELVSSIFNKYKPRCVVHFAAESHVDRSIDGPVAFVQANIIGTLNLLQCAYSYWQNCESVLKQSFRFLHVSTDEVYGSLSFDDNPFTETSNYAPNSPYSASKASSDHFVRAWNQTFGLPVIISHCSNNYGPWQFPEKLIPLMIAKCLSQQMLPVYGNGQNIRDWIHVDDHVSALFELLNHAESSSVWGIGGGAEISNLDLVHIICKTLDELKPLPNGKYQDLVTFVTDRPGHDLRYAISTNKISSKTSWKPKVDIKDGLMETIIWYINSNSWLENISKKSSYVEYNRLGLGQNKGIAK